MLLYKKMLVNDKTSANIIDKHFFTQLITPKQLMNRFVLLSEDIFKGLRTYKTGSVIYDGTMMTQLII